MIKNPLLRSPYRLWRYILLDFFYSFLIILVFFIFIFVGNQVIILAKRVLQIRIPTVEIFKLFLYLLPDVISQAIPYTALVSCLMSVGNFSSSNEFVAMRALGISFIQTFIPYVIFGIFILLLSLLTNEVLLPWGKINTSIQLQRILYLNPQLELEQSSVKRYQDNIIITKRVKDNIIEGLIIIDKDSDNDSRVIFANKAYLVSADKSGVVSLQLNDVVSISTEDKPREYNYFIGKSMTYNILVKDLSSDIQSISADQQSITDLYKYIKQEYQNTIRPQVEEQHTTQNLMMYSLSNLYQIYSQGIEYVPEGNAITRTDTNMARFYTRYNDLKQNPFFNRNFQIINIIFNKKISEPVAVLLFVFIAFPVGLFYKRSGRTIGFGVGLVFSFFYWLLSVLNQSIGATSSLPSALIMWYPNIIILVLGMILLYMRRLQ